MTQIQAGPKRSRRKEERPGEIIEAGLIEFALKGYAGTKLTNVAKRAGISKGTIYHYFGDKDALFRQIFRSRFVDSLGAMGVPVIPDGPVVPILKVAIRTGFEGLAQSDALGLLKIMLVEGDRFPDLIKDCQDDLMAHVAEPIQSLIDRGIAQGELSPGKYRDFPAILFAPGVLIALTSTLTGKGDAKRAAEMFEATFEVLMTGLLNRP